MSRFYYGHNLAAFANQGLADVEAAAAHLRQIRAWHAHARQDLASRYAAALEELVRSLVPTFHPAVLARAAAMTGYAPLGSPAIVAAREDERASLLWRIAEIEHDPRFTNAELLRAPRVGTLSRQIDELVEYLAPLDDLLRRADQHPRFTHLLEVGYGTDKYAVPFWRMSYYADWKAGDEIVALFPNHADFPSFLDEYFRTRQAAATYHEKLAELRREFAAGQALESEHKHKRAMLDSLDERHAARARQHLASYLKDADPQGVGSILSLTPEGQALLPMFKRWSGLAHQILYLDRVTAAQLDPLEQRLASDRQKLARAQAKFSRNKNRHGRFPAESAAWFTARGTAYKKSFDRYNKAAATVYHFNRYDAADFARDFLWWDVMTDGRLDGDFIPEVSAWRREHPGYAFDRSRARDDAFDDEAAAAAIAAAAHDDLSAPDVSGAYDPS